MVKNALIILAIPLILMAYDSEQQNQNKREWITLFNGKNLEGWKIKVTGNGICRDAENRRTLRQKA